MYCPAWRASRSPSADYSVLLYDGILGDIGVDAWRLTPGCRLAARLMTSDVLAQCRAPSLRGQVIGTYPWPVPPEAANPSRVSGQEAVPAGETSRSGASAPADPEAGSGSAEICMRVPSSEPEEHDRA